jgi:hypothetical protein
VAFDPTTGLGRLKQLFQYCGFHLWFRL